MKVAFDEYFTTCVESNRAQFLFFHALRYPAQESACRQPRGAIRPGDTQRPPYVPPAGNGPAPATR